MLNSTVHHPWLRILACILGEAIAAVSINLFIVPLELYSGGIYGVCQLIRTLLQTYTPLRFGSFDIAGVLYFLLNIPIMLFAFRTLGTAFLAKTVLCIVTFSLLTSVVPIPETPIVGDYLTACLLGGILYGVGSGLVLTCGASSGGLDVIGLCLSKKGSRFTVGRFSILFNAVLYLICLLLFVPEIAIYSVIYNFVTSIVLDRVHQQNISVQALIFTREGEESMTRALIEKLDRSVTFWEGVGGYTGEGVHILFVCLSKFEVEDLFRTVHETDPHAFISIQENVHIYGNFPKHLT